MNKVFGTLAIACWFATSAYGSEPEIDRAMENGRLLIEAVEAGRDVSLKSFENRAQIKQYLSKHKCPGLKYRNYVIDTSDGSYLYVVASKGRNAIVGRHFKAPIDNGRVDVEAFESSTKSCINLGSAKGNVAAFTVTHLQPYPNEFHVLVEKVAGRPLYVATEKGLFNVKDGQITTVE
ncbi:MAG: hypothetical protein Kow0020_07760 [Wenzhouxiangellaceae bacterium]